MRRETAENRRAEQEIMDQLSLRWVAKAKKMHAMYTLDFMVFKANEGIAWVEAKDRQDWPDGRDYYMLALHKWKAAHEYLCYTKLPTVIAVWLSGELMTYNVSPIDLGQLKIIEGGRRDRDESSDLEPCVIIPIEKFNPWNELNELWDGPVLPVIEEVF